MYGVGTDGTIHRWVKIYSSLIYRKASLPGRACGQPCYREEPVLCVSHVRKYVDVVCSSTTVPLLGEEETLGVGVRHYAKLECAKQSPDY